MLDAFLLGAFDVALLVLFFRDGPSWGAWTLTLAIGGLQLGAFCGLWIVTVLLWAAALFTFSRYARTEAP